MRILLTGKGGQVGWELLRSLAPLGAVTALDRNELDLTDLAAVSRAVRELKPQVIVNCAAYTAVDRAESEEPLARTVNALAPAAMADEAGKLGALLVHYSTDYVFDGSSVRPYLESDPVSPVSVYGRTKEEGERLIREAGCRHLIFRTAWVYGPRGRNFLQTMLPLTRERDRLRVVSDQIGTPTSSRLIAQATSLFLARHGGQPIRDTVNLTCNGSTSWHGFAARIVQRASELKLCPSRPVDAIPSADYPTPARRPAYSVLAQGKLRQRYGFELPHWQTGLDLVLAELPATPTASS